MGGATSQSRAALRSPWREAQFPKPCGQRPGPAPKMHLLHEIGNVLKGFVCMASPSLLSSSPRSGSRSARGVAPIRGVHGGRREAQPTPTVAPLTDSIVTTKDRSCCDTSDQQEAFGVACMGGRSKHRSCDVRTLCEDDQEEHELRPDPRTTPHLRATQQGWGAKA